MQSAIKDMKIGFDGKRAIKNLTGLGNYSRLVIETMASHFPDSQYLIYTPELTDNPRLKPLKELSNIRFVLPEKGEKKNGSQIWRSYGITSQLKRDRISLYHGLSNEIPLNIRNSGIPTVVTIHDVVYRRLKNCYSLADRLLYNYKYGQSCRNATRIIAMSECTKRDIVEFYGVNPAKIDVVYQGCDDSYKTRPDDRLMASVKNHYQLPERFVLQVGTLEERKNLELTLRALEGLPEDVKLIAVGRDRHYISHIRQVAKELGLTDRLHILSRVPLTELPALYRQASVVAYPSRYEGFGIPILEALESEVPVIAAKGSCLEEAGGDAAIYIDPDSVRQMTEALRAAIEGGDAIRERIALGKQHAARFNNAEIAQHTAEVYRKALRKKA